jgi:hypothetical protein
MAGKISFAGVKTEFEPTPAGIYESKFVDYKLGKTTGGKTPGADQISLQFSVTEENEWKNRRFFRNCVLNADSLWAFKASMAALGADVDWEDPEGVDPEEVAKSVLNAPCLVKVSIREWVPNQNDIDPTTGEPRVKPQNQIDSITPTEVTRMRMQEQAASFSADDSAPAKARK